MPSTWRIASVYKFSASPTTPNKMHALIDECFDDDVTHGSLHRGTLSLTVARLG